MTESEAKQALSGWEVSGHKVLCLVSSKGNWLAGVGGFELTNALPKLAFEVWPEFPFISERLAIRDFSRLSCQRVTCTPVQSISAMNMARRSPLSRGQAMLERRLLWIREFESSHPSQCGLCGVFP